VTVEEIAASSKHALATGPFGSAISARFFTAKGIPVIRGSNLSLDVSDRLNEADLAFIPEGLAAKFERSCARAGDLIFTCWGTVGQVGLIDGRSSYGGYIVSNKQMKLTPNSGMTNSLFLYYAFSNPQFVEYLQSISIGSSVPGFNLGQLRQLTLMLPPLAEQEAIATVLGALDDKIAVNDRIAEISDDLIRQSYSDSSSRANEVVKIGDLSTQVRDMIPAELLTGDENYIALEHMPRRNIWLTEWETATNVASAKSSFRRGDVLFGKLRPYFHKVGIVFVDGVSSTDILVIRPKRESVHGWMLAALSSDGVVAYASAIGDGTRMPRTRWSDLANYQIPWPGEGEVRGFNEFVMPLVGRIGSAATENRTLAELRDTLLPRLMSGEIRVRDAEKVVEKVT
jgi:type I restriction enzyme, S subunit